jgi:hypothetical protein
MPDSLHRAMRTGTGLRLTAPSATRPRSRWRTPLVPLAPTTSSCDRPLATIPRRSRSGSPLVRTVRACHPARRSKAAPRLSSLNAAVSRLTFLRFTSRATACTPGRRRRDGTVVNSTALRSITRPFGGGARVPTSESARFDVADPSTPRTILRTRIERLTTSRRTRHHERSRETRSPSGPDESLHDHASQPR